MATDLLALAQNALDPIRKKLKGMHSLSREKDIAKEIPISSMVEILITEATDLKNLVSILVFTLHNDLTSCLQSKMYIGWSPYF